MKQNDKPLGLVPSALRQPVKPNQLTPIPAGVTIQRAAKPARAAGLKSQKMRAKGGSSDLTLMTARWSY